MKLRRHIRAGRGRIATAAAAATVLALAAPHSQASPTPLAAAAPVAATASSTAAPLSSPEASARAKATGKPVLADAMTTSTREITANPNGSYTMTISSSPVRVAQHGTWVPLSASLHRNPDGTISPAAVPGSLTLSGGGIGPLASMTSNGQQLSVTLPAHLPAPTLAGDTATYANVLPGTDLVVTASTQGGFSDVFVVRTSAAAADPRLAQLLTAHVASSTGLSLRTDAAGDFFAAMPNGHSAFTAPVPAAWDSATTKTTAATGASTKNPAMSATLIPTTVHTPLSSTITGPGRFAHQASLGTALHNGTLTLTEPAAFKSEGPTAFPLYLDPYYGPPIANFATVNSAFPQQPYLDGAGTAGYMQVGYNGQLEGCSPCFNARSFVTLNMAGLPSNAQKISAQVNFWDSWSASCTPEELDLWTTSPISTSSTSPTTWSNQPTWISEITPAKDVSYGWIPGSTQCPANGIGYDITGAVQQVLSAHGPTLTLGLRIPAAQESSNDDNWKQLNGNASGQPVATTASVTYDVQPNTPTGLTTSPTTNCSSNSPTILGDTGVTLYAPVSTPTRANLTTTFDFYKTSAGQSANLLTPTNGIASDTYTGASGLPAVMVLPESFIKAQAGTSLTSFSWIVNTSDGELASNNSAACTFEIDESRPGAPTVTPATSPPSGSQACPLVQDGATNPPVGTSCAFTFGKPNNATISGYAYQVNDSKPVQVPGTGTVTVEFNLPTIVNTLTVSALSPGGNAGSSTTVWFDGSKFDPPEADGDLTADGTPDLIVPGNTTGAFPPGLWLAQGQRNGAVNSYATNIGTDGLGYNTPASASDWNGSEVFSGDFCGIGTQDVMAYFPGAYNPSTNARGGGGAILCGTGTTQPLKAPVSGNGYSPDANAFYDPNQEDNPAVLTNGGNFHSADNGKNNELLYAIVPDGSGTGGAVLDLYVMSAPGTVGGIITSTLAPPKANTNWNNWTITTAQDQRENSSGVLTTYTDMYLWDSATGDLYLWPGVTPNSTSIDAATDVTGTPTGSDTAGVPIQIATNWNTGHNLTLRAADIAGDGNPGLWATDTATGQTTAYIPPATITANPTLTPKSSSLTTATHSWQFTDMPSTAQSGDPINSSTADGDGNMPLTQPSGATGAQWNTGDQFSPDVELTADFANPPKAGYLKTATGSPLNLAQSFTVSLWTKPETNGSTTLSQSGTSPNAYPGLMLYPTTAGWDFYLAKDNGTAAWGGDSITGGNVDFGVWTHLQATYNATVKVMSLYVDDTLVADGSHAIPSNGGATGPLVLGANIDDGTLTSYYSGQIADVETWNGNALAPNQPTTPASYHQAINPERILDTRATGTNHYSQLVQNNTPVGAGTTIAIPITGDSVIPTMSGAPTTIPNTATAVAVDITAVSETANGYLVAYADGTQKPVTSATNYYTGTTITGYEIIPLGANGKIDIYNGSTGTTHVLVDVTGYYTSDAGHTLTGDQTYHPLGTAARALNTANGTGVSKAGPVAAGASFTLQITGTDGIPSTATAVAINLTAFNDSGLGDIEAYQTGISKPTYTSLTYTSGQIASLAADVNIGTGGTITINNGGANTTNIIGDISGYFTAASVSGGEVYHTVNPTRLVDTRIGIGNSTGTIAPIPANGGTYPLGQNDTLQITAETQPTLALMLTSTDSTSSGDLVAYPDNTTPTTSNLNWNTGQNIANLALTTTGTDGGITFQNQSTAGTTDLVVDCSGYFGNY